MSSPHQPQLLPLSPFKSFGDNHLKPLPPKFHSMQRSSNSSSPRSPLIYALHEGDIKDIRKPAHSIVSEARQQLLDRSVWVPKARSIPKNYCQRPPTPFPFSLSARSKSGPVTIPSRHFSLSDPKMCTT
ncbi:hypothetical protein GEMRC1_003611 [Eukaryota sp. GEM-RC1]